MAIDERAKKIFDRISELEKGDIDDRLLAFDLIGILGNELTKESYETRLSIVEKMLDDHLASKKK